MTRLLYLASVVVLLTACKGNDSESATSAAKVDSTAVKAPAEYTCPMHPEIVQKEAGKCPRCGMDLEVKS
jgi:hypothetical protein